MNSHLVWISIIVGYIAFSYCLMLLNKKFSKLYDNPVVEYAPDWGGYIDIYNLENDPGLTAAILLFGPLIVAISLIAIIILFIGIILLIILGGLLVSLPRAIVNFSVRKKKEV